MSESAPRGGGQRHLSSRRRRLRLLVVLLLVFAPPALRAASDLTPPPTVTIARVPRPPTLEDFLEMKPNSDLEGKLSKVEGFIQREPRDGEPSTQRTVVYFGYDDKNFYVIFVAFDSEPGKIRARMSNRENVFGDDTVEVMLDTFHDRRRAYAFITNAFGIQIDALFTEGGSSTGGPPGFDSSFDTVWHSRGQLTDQGYVVWMAIPFKSLRFSSDSQQTWGILFNRDIPRVNEQTFWPRYSSRIEGRLNQVATLEGLENISPGRNIQLIPFGVFRSFRSLDTRDPGQPRFERDSADVDGGLDAKVVFKDSLVLDVAVNPDFSQVESDEPQVTVNQRFEVFFPEKRPFFIENASYFHTPINLVFTRRIADPQFGIRLTGKLGPYALGAFVIDDQSPGKSVPENHPFDSQRALFGIFRVNRDLGKQSTLGFIFTDREFMESFNRVAGVDGRFKLSEHWVTSFQAVASSTRCFPAALFGSASGQVDPGARPRIDGCFPEDSGGLAGPAYAAEISRSGRQFIYRFEFDDRSEGFRTAPGFLRRPDIRRFGQQVGYAFRPEGKYLISWGPFFNTEAVIDHDGLRRDLTQDSSITFEFVGQTELGALYNWDRERLTPEDCPGLAENQDFSRNRKGVFFNSSYFREVSLRAVYTWGTRINFVPPEGRPCTLEDVTSAEAGTTLRLWTALRVDNTYIISRLRDRSHGTGANVFNNHILRSKWNYQFTRELSLRVILQYNAVLTQPIHMFTALDTQKNFNADFLLTYLVHPGTALYVGYNGNAQNIDLLPTTTGTEILRPRDRFINDAKQFFVKFSYLLRF